MQPLQDAYGNTLEIGDWIIVPDFIGPHFAYLKIGIISDTEDALWYNYVALVDGGNGICSYDALVSPQSCIKVSPRSVPLSIRSKILDSIQDNPGALHADRCKLALWNEPLSSL